MCDNSNSESFEYFSKNIKRNAENAAKIAKEAKDNISEKIEDIKKCGKDTFFSTNAKSTEDNNDSVVIKGKLSLVDRLLLTGVIVSSAAAGFLMLTSKK